MINRLLRDSILSGVVIGIISVTFNYIFLFNFDKGYQSLTGNNSFLQPPRIQLIILAINILLFRFMIVKWNRYHTARGLFLVIIIAMAGYVLNRRYHFI